MSLYPGAQQDVKGGVQDVLLQVAFAMQDVGQWLVDAGHSFEDWVCPPIYLRKVK